MRSSFICSALLLSISLTAGAQSFTAPEIKNLIGFYPSKGSIEEKKDFSEMMDLQKSRTVEECEAAGKESRATFKTMFAGSQGPLSQDEMDQAFPKITKVYELAMSTSRFAKSLYRRPRPFVSNTAIKPCIQLENSTAYPSGHTSISRAVARALAELYPERAEILLKRADEIAFHRVLGGVHHPSDIVAGKKLGDAVAKKAGIPNFP